ncbi:hypothetical protein [Mitsuaria sp. GD03876]|uniref:hypothetical protein n=1 Tax=Mitsuaria sp. GD03876 TaxID=2975399 RepID=UPI00244CDF47|nr:hypothetical protein [Mitsuaria sp. GD03876]MDH0867119.1 hypothetical protein [Mitsuaria sp. GD03876]
MLARFVLPAILMTATAAHALSVAVYQPCENDLPCDALSKAPEAERLACAMKHADAIVEGREAASGTGAIAGWRVTYSEELREQGAPRQFVMAMTTARGQALDSCVTTEEIGAKLLPPVWRPVSRPTREEFVRDGGDFEVMVSPSPVTSKESPMCVDFLLIAFRRK